MVCDQELIQLLRQRLQQMPRDPELHRLLLQLMMKLKQFDAAERWWQLAHKINPCSGPLWLLGAELALCQNQEEIAESRLDNASRCFEPSNPLLLRCFARLALWRGEQALSHDELDRGLFLMRRATTIDPSWRVPWLRIAALLRSMRAPQRASWYANQAYTLLVAPSEERLQER